MFEKSLNLGNPAVVEPVPTEVKAAFFEFVYQALRKTGTSDIVAIRQAIEALEKITLNVGKDDWVLPLRL